MSKEDFAKQVKEILETIEEDIKKQRKDGVKEKFKESLKIKDNYKITLETINEGHGVKCATEVKELSYGGAVALLMCLDHIKDMIFEKIPGVKQFYGTPTYELSAKMSTSLGSLLGILNMDDLCKDCDGDCNDDE